MLDSIQNQDIQNKPGAAESRGKVKLSGLSPHSLDYPCRGPIFSFYRAREKGQGDPFVLFDECIRGGGIAAVKGLGGYHLACDARNGAAVARLREKKLRYDKPFAVMMRDMDMVKHFCHVDAAEEAVLGCEKRPIVLLRKKEGGEIAGAVAPNSNRLGVMLPYSPQHCRIMETNEALVMTSANISHRPTIYRDDEAMGALFDIADAILVHNREIKRRMDDSVCQVVSGVVRLLRRSRGYDQEPVNLKGNGKVILALGAQQNNTFCLAEGEKAFLSGYIGDLDDVDAEIFYDSEIKSSMQLFDLEPQIIVCDLHPDYISTRYARHFKNRLPVRSIQHHHAHFASVLAEHALEGNAIGLIFDGTGYGGDGTLWGGEALWGNIAGTVRFGHMLQAPLPGGEAAIREPWRMALAMVSISCGKAEALSFFRDYGDRARLLLQMVERSNNFPMTSGAGRLFDAVAALAGVRNHATYEGQAAIELEQVLDDSAHGSYRFDLVREDNMIIFDWRRLIRHIVHDVGEGCSSGKISARFHRAVVQLLFDVCSMAREKYGCSRVALSGGVFQNVYLIGRGTAGLQKRGFAVYANEKVPANDGGISYGQAAAASRLLEG